MKKPWLFILVLVFSATCLVRPPLFALTAKDAAGREIDIETPVQRVVFLSLYELIPVFGIWESVAGVNRWAYDNEVLKDFTRIGKVPSVGTAESVNVEAMLAMRPDLVITWSYKPEVAEFLIRKGLKVLSVYPESLDELYAVLGLFGSLFGKEERAGEIISLMRENFSRLQAEAAKIPPEKRRKVLWLWGKPTRVSGAVGLQQELFRLIGAINPAGGILTRHPEVSMESIIAWDPDVIFIWGSARYGPADILSNPQWKSVAAVREGRVYRAPTLSSWSPAINGMAHWMAWKIYPEYFDRDELMGVAGLFHRKCFGIPLRLSFD